MNKSIVDALNAQIKEEIASAYIYFGISADMQAKNWKGVALWFQMQAQEELAHAMKIYGYINSCGERAILEAIDKPKQDYGTILEAFETALAHEKYITGKIHGIVKLAREADDIPTEGFMSWFVQEQVEEEAAPQEVIDKLKLVGDAPHILYMIDRELGIRQ